MTAATLQRAIECAALAISEDVEGEISMEMIAGILAATWCAHTIDVIRALEDRVEEIAEYGCRDDDEACGECRPCVAAIEDAGQMAAIDRETDRTWEGPC